MIVLPAFVVAFCAFCTWLIVRIINRSERWAKRTAVAMSLLAYPISIGPACWISSRAEWGEGFVTIVYQPILWFVSGDVQQPARRLIFTYAEFGSDPRWAWFCYADAAAPSGQTPWQWGQLPRY